MKTRILLLISASVATAWMSAANVYTFYSTKDNTIIETTDGSKGNSKNTIYVGNIAQSPSIRRGLVAFDLSSLPSGITIDSAKLVMSLSSSTNNTLEIHKVTSNWTEGSSSATGGAGVAATANDVTWLHSSYSTVFWTTAGGDFETTAAATASISAGATSVSFSGTALTAQVAAWIANPTTNYGWLLKSNNETTASGNIEKFYSRESATSDALKPTLLVYYTLTDINGTAQSANADVYPSVVSNSFSVRSVSTLKSVEVYDMSGKKVVESQLTTIDVSGLSKGMYLVKLFTAEGSRSQKIVKL